MVTIIDYGMGNLGSIHNMFCRIGVPSVVTSDAKQIKQAKKILLPGVGAFDAAMKNINASGLRDILDEKVLVDKIPVLGICLGMQLLTKGSEEGSEPGLGWVDGTVKRFPKDLGLKIPHMGWNRVVEAEACPLIEGLPEEKRFYFVHSYYVKMNDPKNVSLRTQYGVSIDAGIQKDNIFGFQFHPESILTPKGSQLMKQSLEWLVQKNSMDKSI